MNLIRKVMIILLILVMLFLAGMGVISHLNLTYSKDALTQLRRQQIEEAVRANLDRIDAHTTLIEHHVGEVADVTGISYQQSGMVQGNAMMEAFLRKTIAEFPEAAGIGVWLEPTAAGGYFAPFAYWNREANRVELIWQFSDAAHDYSQEAWYRTAVEAFRGGGGAVYWLPARFNSVIDDAVITVASPIRTADGNIVGLSTIDWRFSRVIDLVRGVAVTENSFAFLINDQNQKLSSLSEDDTRVAQEILAILDLELFDFPEDPATLSDKSMMQEKDLALAGRDYAVYYAKARSGMIFGVSVPRDEMYQVIDAMRQINYRVLAASVVVLLLMSAILLHAVAGIMRLLDTLYTDNITGLPNRMKLLQDLKEERKPALILIDIDSFKEVDDFYGYECGDALLQDLGCRIGDFLAQSKNCSPARASLYKMPADVFAVLLKKTDGTRLGEWLEQMIDFLKVQTYAFRDQEISLDFTLGGAVWERPDESAESTEVVSNANMALQLAKKQRKPALIYDRDMGVREGYEQNLIWANRLKKALEEDRLQPYFQPIINNATGRVEKFECLVRLLGTDGQPHAPYHFMGVSRRLKLYHLITRTIVDKSLRQFQKLPYDLSLNLSYEDVVDAETYEFILQRLRVSGISARVAFELLESESIDNYDDVHRFIVDAKSLGCRISIDDFGSGYSNFEHLLKLNADMIKLDGSLIRNLDQDKNAYILAQGIVGFARRMNLKTAAEFVCSEAVCRKVLELGIDYSQGYYFSEPVASLDGLPLRFELPAAKSKLQG